MKDCPGFIFTSPKISELLISTPKYEDRNEWSKRKVKRMKKQNIESVTKIINFYQIFNPKKNDKKKKNDSNENEKEGLEKLVHLR